MRTVYLSITENCNLSCRHCMGSYGPGGRSMDEEVLDRVIASMLSKPPLSHAAAGRVVITGGEPLTQRALVEQAARKLASYRDDFQPYIAVQSNGFWAADVDSAKEVIESLSECGVDWYDIAGNDQYHDEECWFRGYIKSSDAIENINMAIMTSENISGERPHAQLRGASSKILPFGRAATLKEAVSVRESILTFDDVYVDVDGGVRLCQYQRSTLFGSLLDKHLWELMSDVSYGMPGFQILVDDGLLGLAQEKGGFSEDQLREFRKNPCNVCDEHIDSLLDGWETF